MISAKLKRKWDQKAVMDYIQQEGFKIGMEKGMKEGIEKGIEKIIKSLIVNTRFSNEEIAKITEEDIELIEKCRSQINQ